MPSLNSNIGLSPPIKRNKRRTFDEYSIESQEVINRTKSNQLLITAKNALLESFILDQNLETAIVIDNINSLLTKKSIKPKEPLEMIDWKLNRVLEQSSKIPETTGKSVRPKQANSNGNSNLTKKVNQAIRRETAGVPGPQLNESTKIWSQMLGIATANSENWTTVSRSKKSNTNSNSNKFDNTDDFNAIKSRRLIITPKAQIGDIDSLLLRNQINSLFKDAKSQHHQKSLFFLVFFCYVVAFSSIIATRIIYKNIYSRGTVQQLSRRSHRSHQRPPIETKVPQLLIL